MDATLGFILIFVLAVVLVALGIGLSRRSQRQEQAPTARPIAAVELEQAPRAAATIADAGTAQPEAEPKEEEAEPRLKDRLGKSRAAFARLRGRSRIDEDIWEDLEDTLLLADVGMP